MGNERAGGAAAIIKINDVEVRLHRCGHCGVVPTEADAQTGLSRVPIWHCVICGRNIRLRRMGLKHVEDVDGPRWSVEFSETEPSITFWRRNGPLLAHAICARRAMPFAQFRGVRDEL